jgi:transposase InsO family protein
MGPFPTDSFGFTYLIVIICCFSRYVELYPVRDTTAESAAHASLEHTCRYGASGEVVSDNGPEYVNNIISDFFKLLDTQHILTLAYSKVNISGIV